MSTQVYDLLLKSTLTGVTAAAGAYFIFGQTTSQITTLPIIGDVHSILAIAALTVLSRWIGSLSENYILPYLPNNENYAALENKLLNPILPGGLLSLLFYNNL